MADSIDIYNQYPLVLDPTSKAINLSSQTTTPASASTVTTELTELNALHRGLFPINPKRSAQITKLRDSANTAYRKNNHAEAVRLYTYAIEMGIARPGWEPMSLAREELAGLFANRAQAYMAQQAWPEGLVDAKCSVESKPVGNVKAWWRAGKCLAEMGRWDEAQVAIDKGLEFEPRNGEGAKELLSLMEEVKEGMKRANSSSA
ncbi:chaperone binding protein, putative [Aspergillus oryzae 100-8]|nr:chaperone binding protein, putative [Aspergillus oryzae 100-8]